MTARCEAFLENPEQHPQHLAECESCRRLESGLSVQPDAERRVANLLSRLPVAPWEGAGHRAWGMVGIVGALVIAAAAALFLMSGHSPVDGFEAALRTLVPSFDVVSVTSSISALLEKAPRAFHLFVATAFVVVNLLFVFLLRRPPKGYDVTIR